LFAGGALREVNRLADSESRLIEALRLLSSSEGSPSVSYLRGLQELASLYEQMGRFTQAESLLRRALDQHGRAPETDPEGQGRCHHALSDLCSMLGRYRQAGESLRAAQDIRARALGKEHPEFARGLLTHAWIAFQLGESLAAEGHARLALKILRGT